MWFEHPHFLGRFVALTDFPDQADLEPIGQGPTFGLNPKVVGRLSPQHVESAMTHVGLYRSAASMEAALEPHGLYLCSDYIAINIFRLTSTGKRLLSLLIDEHGYHLINNTGFFVELDTLGSGL